MTQDLLPHLLRPQSLWLLLGMPVLAWLWWRRRRRADVWRGLVDAHLLPHLLVGRGRGTRWGVLALLLGYGLAVFALAGPSWRKVPQPTWQTRAPLVVALDLSDRVLASDLPPSRLLQARAKLAELLRERQGGQVALLVYAGDAFTVAPLTPDAANVALFLDALSPTVVPVSGQRADLAIERGVALLQQAGFPHGQILLMSDQADSLAQSAASRARQLGFQVSALGLGTASGATYRDGTGRFERATLDAGSLQRLAASGGGRYATLTRDTADLRALGVLDPGQADAGSVDRDGSRDWDDQGYWMLPALMLLVLLVFRRGAGALSVLALCLVLPIRPAQAAGIDWWQRADQRRYEQLSDGAKAYRSGDFAAAEQVFKAQPGAQAQYNLGNALAKQGRYDEAIAAYDRALRQSPGMADAIANRAAVDAARRRQQSGDQGKNGQGNNKRDASQQGQPNPGDRQQGQSGQSGQGQDGQVPPPDKGRGEQDKKQQDTPPADTDAEAQKAADEAQKQRMQRAMAQQGEPPQDDADRQRRQQAMAAETPEQREQRQAVDAWLRRVPDDPGGLLRAKFEREYQRRQQGGR